MYIDRSRNALNIPAPMPSITIRGARTHNLRNIDLELPRDRLIVFTGLSGSGKSSLAFDTIYAEGQRRYVESLSAYARQFLSMMEKPDVDSIEGLSPAIAIEQKSTSHNPRSTVGTVTEIYDHLRLLFARVGIPRCPDHGNDLLAQTVSQMVDQVLRLPEGTPILLLAPLIDARKGEHAHVIEQLRGQGFVRARIDGIVAELETPPQLDPKKKHTIEAVVDRLKVRSDVGQRLAESFETALRLADGVARVSFMDDAKKPELVFSDKFACPICGYSISELEPRLFSFNNPAGACPTCSGLGVQQFFDPARVVHHTHLSLAGGDSRLGPAQRVLLRARAVAREALQVRRRGAVAGSVGQEPESGAVRQRRREIDFRYVDARGGTMRRAHKWEGVIPNLERRYRETESLAVREELAKYLSNQPCPECGGTRLNRAARNCVRRGADAARHRKARGQQCAAVQR
jgi:excinuclease ABC subunit A